MANKKVIVRYRFKKSVLDKMNNDGVLLVKISNIIGGDIKSLLKSIERDSQTLMHIAVIVAVSERFNMDIKSLYEKVK